MVRPQDHVSMTHWEDCQERCRPLEAEKRRIRRRSLDWASAKSGHRPSRRPGGETGAISETGGTGETIETVFLRDSGARRWNYQLRYQVGNEGCHFLSE